MKDYTPSIPHGSRLLNSGKTLEALICFLEVKLELIQQAAPSPMADRGMTAEIEQLLGICYRMLGRYSKARVAFENAFRLANNARDRGRILRDQAMLWLVQGQLENAWNDIRRSLEMLLRPEDAVEYACSVGFQARLFGKQGELYTARDHHRRADELLRQATDDPSEPIYELNNLVWWLKVEKGFRSRYRLSRRAWRLAKANSNRKRQLQIALLLTCRPLSVRFLG